MRVLVVEDSPNLRETIALVLRETGYAVDETGDGEEGLWKAQSYPYDVIVLDLMLPGLDGLSVLRELRRENNQTQILILSARDTVDDRVGGLEAGADDYLVKPFAIKELLARVEALCRRAYGKKNPSITIGALEIDTRSKSVSCSGQSVSLTAREYAILEFLALREGEVVSRTEIESHVYDDLVTPMSNVVDRAICVLRKKIAGTGDNAPGIQTRRGQGYLIEATSG